MRHMLDTNICIYLIKRKPLQVIDRLRALAIADVVISSVTLAELEYGVAKSARPEQNNEALNAFLAPLDILAFDDQAACRYGEIRAFLEKKGQLIGAMDMMIAAHAASLSMTLVTNYMRDFKRVPGLFCENWL